MGEILSSSTHAESQLGTLQHSLLPLDVESADTPAVDGDEEPYTITCICGYAEDDGSTVLCEQCNTWQHIECYYPGANVPDVHTCNDCSPRALDVNGAALSQKRMRDVLRLSEDRKVKRPSQKSHKKTRTKESNSATAPTNGWSTSEKSDPAISTERKRSSPKDQQPIPKRPKTAHRSSATLSSGSLDSHRPAGQRKRSGSNLATVPSPVKSPIEQLPDYFSPEFIKVHHFNVSFVPAQTNLYLDIRVTNLLSKCLDPSEFAAATNGCSASDYLKRSTQPIEELFAPVLKQVLEDHSLWFHGHHPRWPHLIVQSDVVHNSLIGELRGHIGLWDNYKNDPTNRWSTLRHPDHFVFFHPVLPIYIDARSEGTEMRYVRRSCRPNSKLETIITEEREYRFCLLATQDLQAGDEVTIGWELHQELYDCLSRVSSNSASEAEREYFSSWVEGLLANFGGCACSNSPGQECLMARFDRRLSHRAISNGRGGHSSKARKGKKRSSPGDGTVGNSRASSEARLRGEPDDDDHDVRSTTQSSRSRNSRDASPSSHGIGEAKDAALSERDKRKLQHQERLFEQLEQEQHGQRRKKRSSGSNVNTPSASTTRLFGHNGSATSALPPLTPFALSNYHEPQTSPYEESTPLQTPDDSSPSHSLPLRRAAYVDRSTQTPVENDDVPVFPRRRRYVSLTQKLLKRCHLASMAAGIPNGLKTEDESDSNSPQILQAQDATTIQYSIDIKTSAVQTSPQSSLREDDKLLSQTAQISATPQRPLVSASQQTELQPAHPPLKPPPPPWPGAKHSNESRSPRSLASPVLHSDRSHSVHRSTELHVDLPPPPAFLPIDSCETPGTSNYGAFLQSPVMVENGSSPSVPLAGPPFVAALNSITQPSPAKKKMSLSDYMNKKKVETPSIEKSQKQSQTIGGSDSVVIPQAALNARPLAGSLAAGVIDNEMQIDETSGRSAIDTELQ